MTQTEVTPTPGTAVARAELPASATSWAAQTFFLTGWYLRAVRRRVMGKVLFWILIGLFAAVVSLQVAGYFIALDSGSEGATNCVPAPVTTQQAGERPGGQPQQCQPPSQQEIQAAREAAAAAVRQTLTIPGSLAVAGGLTTFIGLILLVILAGAVVGGEYGYGTIRVALGRGVGRGQFIVGQAAALAVLALFTAGLMVALGSLVGATVGPLLGATLPAVGLEGAWEIVLFWLALSLNLFAFAAIALFMATLGRSTAAGIGFALGYFIFEGVAQGIVFIVATLLFSQPASADFVHHIPDWFIGNNVAFIVRNVSQAPLVINGPPLGGEAFDMTHALLVALAYLVVLIGGSYLLLRRRDVTD